METIKHVIVGDGGVGKTSLFAIFAYNVFPYEYVPTSVDGYARNVTVDGKLYTHGLFNTAGQEDYDRLRPLTYPLTDVFFVAFSVDNRASFENIPAKWKPELDRYMPEVPKILVACKTDLRAKFGMVTPREVAAMARNLAWPYVETSALKQDTVHAAFDLAVQTAVNYMNNASKNSKKGIFGSKNRKDTPIPPAMPPAGEAPWLEVGTSQMAQHWQALLQSGSFADVTFVLGQQRLQGHKLLLASASSVFASLFRTTAANMTEQMRTISGMRDFTHEDVNAGRVEGLAAIYEAGVEGEEGRTRTTVEVSADISPVIFLRVLEFLYTGLPLLREEPEEETLHELSRVADIFKLPRLRTVCENLEKEEEFLNPSIGTFLNDQTAARFKELAFNSHTHADVVFNVEGTKVYAHKFVLSARCEVLSAMFSGKFMEGQTDSVTEVTLSECSAKVFLAFLEYLYTDHSPIEEVDGMELLVLADQYNQSRLLNLCELHVTKQVNRACEKRIKRAEIDVIGLLNMAELYNAKQLSNWCLHFISTNYDAFSRRKEFSALSPKAREHVDEHRWPPLDYLEAAAEYEAAMKKLGSKCVVM